MTDTPKLCKACFTGSIIPGDPKGEFGHLNGTKYYIAKADPTGRVADKAIVIATDIFGIGIPNPCIVADELAARTGMDVYVPDLLQGDYANAAFLNVASATPNASKPLLERVSSWTKSTLGFLWFVGPTFVYRHRMSVMVPLAVKDLKKEVGAKELGMAGYCLGGQVTTLLAASPTSPISVFVTAHPGFLKVDDFKRIRRPYALICSQEDFAFDHIKKDALKAVDALSVQHVVYHHPGTTHGFAARPDVTDATVKAAYEKALEETADWFKMHL
ncbi:carboxymethylenebutenolidase [Pseudohyphozyma bogoriensis]|nr:carboxymethylenebutenolidase [Pseudohyphozyma bogoriensis]